MKGLWPSCLDTPKIESSDSESSDSDLEDAEEDTDTDISESEVTSSYGSYTSEAGTYALFMGRFTFHTKIPLLRKLWEYRYYPEKGGDIEKGSVVEHRDYPLHHYLFKLTGWRRREVLVESVSSPSVVSRSRRRRRSRVESVDESPKRKFGYNGFLQLLGLRRRRSPKRSRSPRSDSYYSGSEASAVPVDRRRVGRRLVVRSIRSGSRSRPASSGSEV